MLDKIKGSTTLKIRVCVLKVEDSFAVESADQVVLVLLRDKALVQARQMSLVEHATLGGICLSTIEPAQRVLNWAVCHLSVPGRLIVI